MVAAMLSGGDDDRNPLPVRGGMVHTDPKPHYAWPEDEVAAELARLGRKAMGMHVHRRLDSLVDVGSSQPPEAVIIPPEGYISQTFGLEDSEAVEYNEPTIEMGLSGLSDLPSLLERGTGLGYEIGFEFKRLSDKEGTILAVIDTSRPTGHPGGPGISAGSWPESEFGHRCWYDYTFETPAAVVFRQTEYGHGGTIYAMFPTRDPGWGANKYFYEVGYPSHPDNHRLGYTGDTSNWGDDGYAQIRMRVWDAGSNTTGIWSSNVQGEWMPHQIKYYPTGTTANGTPPSSPITLDGVLHLPVTQYFGRTNTWDGVSYLANVETVYTNSASHLPGLVIPTIRAGGAGNFGTVPGSIRGFYVFAYEHESESDSEGEVAAL